VKRFLFITSPERGHVHPVLGVAQHLVQRGHRVVWAFVPHAPSFAIDGIEVISAGGTPMITGGAELAALLRDSARLQAWIRALLIDSVPAQIDRAREWIRALDPHVVAPDPMIYQGAIAAHLEGKPWVSMSSSLNPITPPDISGELGRTVADLSDAREELFAAHGMSPRFALCDCISPYFTSVFASPRYARTFGPIPSGIEALGPSRALARPASGVRIARGDRPIVYASFGSQASHQPERFEKIVAATADLGVRLVISSNLDLRAPHLELHPFVDQIDLLAHTALFISHGGANSTMEAIDAGVPMLVAPIANDQPMQSSFVTASGVGVTIDLERCSIDSLREAIAERIGPCREREIVSVYAREQRELDGARAAADALERLA
jgi:zeaxanthin glucosyltransferase